MNFWPYPILFAHRGGGALAPENTLAGVKMAQHHGYSAVEFDVKLSADGVAMLMHDDTLERTSNGVGMFKEKTVAMLETLDAGTWKGAAFADEKIPRFSAVMKFLHNNGMNANIEIKPCTGRESETGRAVAALAEEITRAHAVKPLLSSFSLEALRAAHATATGLPIGLLVGDYAREHDVLLDELDAVSLNCHYRCIDVDMVRHLHARGTRVMVYTVNDIDRVAELMKIGVDGIFTDNLDGLARHFPDARAGA